MVCHHYNNAVLSILISGLHVGMLSQIVSQYRLSPARTYHFVKGVFTNCILVCLLDGFCMLAVWISSYDDFYAR